MKIKYIYIDKYKDIITDLNLNLGGVYRYKYKYNELYKEKKKDYINRFYNEYNVVDEITGIIGKNSSGKTTILRLINDILSSTEKNFKFIIIIEIDGNDFYSSNIANLKLSDIKFISLDKLIQSKSIGLVFFSSIFDKSSNLNSSNKLIDISTNKLLRLYINNYYYDSMRTLYDDNNGDILYEDIDLIDNFRHDEILKLFKYFIKTNKNNKFNPLVKLPKHLNISYGDSSEEKTNRLIDLKDKNKRGYIGLVAINDLADEVMFEQIDDNNARQYKNEFILMLMFEVFYKLIIDKVEGIEDIIDKFVSDLYEQDELLVDNIALNALETIINNELTRDLYIIKEVELLEEDIDEFEKEDINSIYNDNKTNIIEQVTIDIDYLIEQLEYGEINNSVCENCNSIVLKIQYIIENIDNLIECINKYLIRIKIDILDIKDSIEYIQDYEISEEILEEINLNNNLIKELIIIEEDEYEEYEKSNLDELNKDKENEIVDNIYYNLRQDIYDEYESDSYEQKNQEVIDFVNKIKTIIKIKSDIINKNQVKKELNNVLNLQVKWKNENIIELIREFESLNLETFYLVYNHQDLSSGQNAYLDMLSRLIDNFERIKSRKHIIFLIDEGDINLHPEIQIKFVKNLLQFLREFFDNNKFHIILTSNSPFIISDLLNSNIIYLERETTIKNSSKDISKLRTFGANINELLIDSFFMENGSIGEFAQDRIDYIIESLNSGRKDDKEAKFLKQNIEIIGDEILRAKLLDMYKSVYGIRKVDIKNKIDFYRQKILELEAMTKLYD